MTAVAAARMPPRLRGAVGLGPGHGIGPDGVRCRGPLPGGRLAVRAPSHRHFCTRSVAQPPDLQHPCDGGESLLRVESYDVPVQIEELSGSFVAATVLQLFGVATALPNKLVNAKLPTLHHLFF